MTTGQEGKQSAPTANSGGSIKFEGKITKSSIYSDHISEYKVDIEAESVEEAAKRLNTEAIRFDIRSGASSLVQDVLLNVEGKWVHVSDILRSSRARVVP